MAIFAHLMTDLRCPSCNTVVSDIVWFQWGFCRGYDMWPESETCQGVLEGAMVEIRDGVIKRAWIDQPGEFDDETQEYIIQADGTLKPMPEWKDHPMGLVRPGC